MLMGCETCHWRETTVDMAHTTDMRNCGLMVNETQLIRNYLQEFAYIHTRTLEGMLLAPNGTGGSVYLAGLP